MKIAVYLHEEIAATLLCFGNLSDVINKILDNESVLDKPSCLPREGASKYTVDVTNEEYLSLLARYPATSPRISLRRLLYWWVDNEIYTEWGWKPNKYLTKYQQKYNEILSNVIDNLNMAKALDKSKIELLDTAISTIKEAKL